MGPCQIRAGGKYTRPPPWRKPHRWPWNRVGTTSSVHLATRQNEDVEVAVSGSSFVPIARLVRASQGHTKLHQIVIFIIIYILAESCCPYGRTGMPRVVAADGTFVARRFHLHNWYVTVPRLPEIMRWPAQVREVRCVSALRITTGADCYR